MNPKEQEAIHKALDVLQRQMLELITPIASDLAQLDTYGMLMASGRRNSAGKKFYIALATNDAATHLEEWAAKQIAERSEAGLRAGLNIVSIVNPKAAP